MNAPASRLRRPSVHLAGRAGWAVIDQGVVSLANFGLGVIVARLVSPTEFGAFGVAFAIYLVVLNVARGFATQPLTIRFGKRDDVEFRRGAADATGVSLAVGLAGSLVSLGLAAVVGGGVLSVALSALAIALPGLMLQDAWRFVLFTARRGRVAIINDVIATVVMAVLIAVVVAADAVSVFTMVLSWGGGSLAAAIVGIRQSGATPRPRRSKSWLREHWDIAPRFLGSDLIQMGGAQLVLFALGVIVGLAAVGSVRGAQLLTGPIYVLSVGMTLSMVPEVARLTESMGRFRQMTLWLTGGLSAAGIAWGVVLLLLPDSIGRQLLGATWPGARSVLVPIALSVILPLGTVGAQIGLRALEDTSRALRASGIQFFLTIIGGVGGAVAGGTEGAAWGLAIGMGLSGLTWWVQLLRAMRHRVASGREPRSGTTTPTVDGSPMPWTDLPIDAETLSRGKP